MEAVHDAIVLAGGSGRRLGGVDKATLSVAGRSLLDRALEAVDRAGQIVVVGPVDVPRRVRQVVEDPPGGGPVAGLVAGMTALADGREPAEWVAVVAVDQPAAAEALAPLLSAAGQPKCRTDGFCQEDAGGHPQWLLAVYRRESLARALEPVGTGHGVSVRQLVSELNLARIREGAASVGDIDTWEDHQHWEERLG